MNNKAGGLLVMAFIMLGYFSEAPDLALAQNTSPQTGITIFSRGSFISQTSIFGRSGGLLVEGTRVTDPLGRKNFAYTSPFNFGYGITSNWQFMINLPLLFKAAGVNPTTAAPRIVNANTGLGDVTLLLKYRFFKMDRFDPEKNLGKGTTQLAFTAGPKLPTGSTKARDRNGSLLPPPLQSSSGSTDMFFALGLTNTFAAPESGVWSLKRWQITASGTYLLRTVGTQDFKFSNLLELRGGIQFRPYQVPFPGPEWWIAPLASLEIYQRARARGVAVANSGGHVLFLGLLTIFSPHPRWTFSGGVDFPVVTDLHGTQLAPRPRFYFGVTRQFRLGGRRGEDVSL